MWIFCYRLAHFRSARCSAVIYLHFIGQPSYGNGGNGEIAEPKDERESLTDININVGPPPWTWSMRVASHASREHSHLVPSQHPWLVLEGLFRACLGLA